MPQLLMALTMITSLVTISLSRPSTPRGEASLNHLLTSMTLVGSAGTQAASGPPLAMSAPLTPVILLTACASPRTMLAILRGSTVFAMLPGTAMAAFPDLIYVAPKNQPLDGL